MDPLPQLRALAEAMSRRDAAALAAIIDELYDERVFFQDPLVTALGRADFQRINRHMLAAARELSLEFIDVLAAGDQLALTWKMIFVPRVGPRVTIDGASHLRLRDGRVTHHRDYWDLLGSVASGVPVFGHLYRSLTAKLL